MVNPTIVSTTDGGTTWTRTPVPNVAATPSTPPSTARSGDSWASISRIPIGGGTSRPVWDGRPITAAGHGPRCIFPTKGRWWHSHLRATMCGRSSISAPWAWCRALKRTGSAALYHAADAESAVLDARRSASARWHGRVRHALSHAGRWCGRSLRGTEPSSESSADREGRTGRRALAAHRWARWREESWPGSAAPVAGATHR